MHTGPLPGAQAQAPKVSLVEMPSLWPRLPLLTCLGTQLCSGARLAYSFPIAAYLGSLVGVEALWKVPLLTRLLLGHQAAQHHRHWGRGAGKGPVSREMEFQVPSPQPSLHSTSPARLTSHAIFLQPENDA